MILSYLIYLKSHFNSFQGGHGFLQRFFCFLICPYSWNPFFKEHDYDYSPYSPYSRLYADKKLFYSMYFSSLNLYQLTLSYIIYFLIRSFGWLYFKKGY